VEGAALQILLDVPDRRCFGYAKLPHLSRAAAAPPQKKRQSF